MLFRKKGSPLCVCQEVNNGYNLKKLKCFKYQNPDYPDSYKNRKQGAQKERLLNEPFFYLLKSAITQYLPQFSYNFGDACWSCIRTYETSEILVPISLPSAISPLSSRLPVRHVRRTQSRQSSFQTCPIRGCMPFQGAQYNQPPLKALRLFSYKTK